MTKFALTALAASAVMLSGCASTSETEAASAKPVNTICPIGGHEVPDNDLTATHNGYVVAFCCEGCADTWDGESQEGRDEILAAALKNVQAE